eukprot:Opistho-1_new@17726
MYLNLAPRTVPAVSGCGTCRRRGHSRQGRRLPPSHAWRVAQTRRSMTRQSRGVPPAIRQHRAPRRPPPRTFGAALSPRWHPRRRPSGCPPDTKRTRTPCSTALDSSSKTGETALVSSVTCASRRPHALTWLPQYRQSILLHPSSRSMKMQQRGHLFPFWSFHWRVSSSWRSLARMTPSPATAPRSQIARIRARISSSHVAPSPCHDDSPHWKHILAPQRSHEWRGKALTCRNCNARRASGTSTVRIIARDSDVKVASTSAGSAIRPISTTCPSASASSSPSRLRLLRERVSPAGCTATCDAADSSAANSAAASPLPRCTASSSSRTADTLRSSPTVSSRARSKSRASRSQSQSRVGRATACSH